MPNPKRILILGPESTGKSTLAEDLANHFGEPWVPEYAREYLEDLGREYRYEDMLAIGKGQVALEDEIAKKAEKYLFCDTDLRVIHIWSEHRFGKTHPWVLDQIAERKYDLILLTDTDLPWTPDPQREYPELEMRNYFLDLYKKLAGESGFPHYIISGSREKRLEDSISHIKNTIFGQKT
ncbi:nicotinamide-nucleotide adenylyltransferase, NadR type [Algoriphagus locisalis]|uniref:Nicotinamide-nucleotide adenylyltransferase, NadR type n=1 Tax=Algoriphagus locisalis TaxID=305507 RepID=A0A1I7DBA3_9BACT|nr:ATP-binding protein [Algoriphagus locisalis]SFU08971.1 nicotinamide-nucleotide adenylyltransferase, NadR type [Algoriphagus locisalis]